jgi:hypothetical protein
MPVAGSFIVNRLAVAGTCVALRRRREDGKRKVAVRRGVKEAKA